MNVILLLALLGSITDPVPPPAWLRREPVPPPMNLTVVETEHSGQPITVPTAVPHNYRGWGSCSCTMCLGLHAVNMHRMTTAELDKIGYRAWPAYHAKLHDVMGTPKESGCPGGVCSPRTTRGLRRWR